MKVQKAKWWAVNCETGTVLQVNSVMTKHKAERIFLAHEGNLNGFVILAKLPKN
jgi:hypothetical protein